MLGRELRSWGYLKSLHNRELRSYPQVSKYILLFFFGLGGWYSPRKECVWNMAGSMDREKQFACFTLPKNMDPKHGALEEEFTCNYMGIFSCPWSFWGVYTLYWTWCLRSLCYPFLIEYNHTTLHFNPQHESGAMSFRVMISNSP